MYEVLALEFKRVIFSPVATNGQDSTCIFDDRDDIGQCDPCLVVVLIDIVEAVQIQVHERLVQGVAVVVDVVEPSLLVFGFLDRICFFAWVWQVDITVKPSGLQFQNVVFVHAHLVRHTGSHALIGRAVGQDHVFCGDEHRSLASEAGILVHLFERRARSGQAPQHAFHLRAELWHLLDQLVVHVLFDVMGGLFFLRRFFAPDGCAHRPLGWEHLSDRF